MIEPVVPMQPVQVDEPFDDSKWLYQIKWDGVRMLSYFDADGVRLVNRKLRDHTFKYPDLTTALAEQVRAKSVILDGEIVGFGEDGKPTFSASLKRDLVKSADKAQVLARTRPAYYMVWDILYADGRWLLEEPLSRRQQRLADVLEPGPSIKLVDSHDAGTALFRVMQEQEMEGIVAKEREGIYRLGEYNPTWKKIKHYRFVHAVVGGAIVKSGLVNSLLIGLYQEDQLIYIGRAATGLDNAMIQALTQFVNHLPSQPPPFQNPPRHTGNAYEKVVWFPPQLVVEVRFMEWTSDLTLRAPVVLGFRETEVRACVF
ncbi:RNA ligase family protein [Tumebacillus permanentifrigoris]|uniref:DNA ligase (ATP) n=1 Tax=Tumebacillus permanentifrigoris TaxID=378543 RepID=A0A316DEG6_9BACL|nr:RNA ligase family protein [Tumebacillus permanentifrigoris]PWK15569.1 bifunctional non-homologous end joining protein LigD [Tumebacillus permanentifrigoris]